MGGTILVVEDDELSRFVLTAALERAGYNVTPARNGCEVADLIQRARPDLAIVDLNLGDSMNGFDVAKQIRQDSDAAIIFLSAASSLDDRLSGFDVGGDDFVVKPVSLAELLARIDAVLRRLRPGESGPLTAGDVTLDEMTRTAVRGESRLRLTNLEFSLLRCLVRNRNKVMSKRDLLAEVWGYDEFDQNLVEVYVSSLRKKLEAHGPRLVHTVRGRGYVLRGG